MNKIEELGDNLREYVRLSALDIGLTEQIMRLNNERAENAEELANIVPVLSETKYIDYNGSVYRVTPDLQVEKITIE